MKKRRESVKQNRALARISSGKRKIKPSFANDSS